MWYRDWFRDSNYLTVYQHRDSEEAEHMLDLIERTLGREPDWRVLDLGCGSGRHSLSLAKRGYTQLTAVDLSPTLLDVARKLAKEEGYDIEFVERDMRSIEANAQYDLVVNLFTSFGYFETDEENASVLRTISASLRVSGWLVLDFFNAHWLRTHLVAHDERVLPEGKRLEQTRWIENGRIEKRLLLRSREEAHEFVESVRMFTLEDFRKMLTGAGLEIQHLFGSYDGSTFNAELSPRLILFAQKR